MSLPVSSSFFPPQEHHRREGADVLLHQVLSSSAIAPLYCLYLAFLGQNNNSRVSFLEAETSTSTSYTSVTLTVDDQGGRWESGAASGDEASACSLHQGFSYQAVAWTDGWMEASGGSVLKALQMVLSDLCRAERRRMTKKNGR